MSLRAKAFDVPRRGLRVRSWALPFAPGGTLKIRLPKPCAVTVHTLDPHKHDWQTAHIELHVDGETHDTFMDEETGKEVADAFELSVVSDREPGRNFLQLETPPETTPTALARTVHAIRRWIGGPMRGDRPLFDSRVAVRVGVPGRLDVDVELGAGGPLTVDGTIEGDVRVQTGSADVHLDKLKSMHVDIDVDDGDVVAQTVQGSLHVRSGAGNIDVGRAQGPVVKVDTMSGDVQMRAVYADYALMRSREGVVRLGGAQGYMKVRTVEGDVEVAGVEGRLDIETDAGDVEAMLSAPRLVTVRSRTGDVKIGVPEALRAGVLLEGGESVTVGDGVRLRREVGVGADSGIVGGFIGEAAVDEPASVHARAPKGEVSVTQQSWGHALGLNGSEQRERFPRWVSST